MIQAKKKNTIMIRSDLSNLVNKKYLPMAIIVQHLKEIFVFSHNSLINF